MRDLFSSYRWHTYTSRVLRLILPYNPSKKEFQRVLTPTNINLSFLFDWVYLSNYLCKPFCQGRIAFFCPHCCNCVVSCTAKKKKRMQCNGIIIIVSLSYHCRRECQSSSKWRMTAEWSLTSLRMLLHHHWFLSSVDSQVQSFVGECFSVWKKVVLLCTICSNFENYHLLQFSP